MAPGFWVNGWLSTWGYEKDLHEVTIDHRIVVDRSEAMARGPRTADVRTRRTSAAMSRDRVRPPTAPPGSRSGGFRPQREILTRGGIGERSDRVEPGQEGLISDGVSLTGRTTKRGCEAGLLP